MPLGGGVGKGGRDLRPGDRGRGGEGSGEGEVLKSSGDSDVPLRVGIKPPRCVAEVGGKRI